jgi:hypothetical protein
MLWTIAVILWVLWALGVMSGASLGLWIHLFFAAGFVMVVLAVASLARRAALRGL